MAYHIININKHTPELREFYFLDANVWIAVLESLANSTIGAYERPYIDFVEAVVVLHSYDDPKLLKKIKNQPKFVMTSLLLSEIINTYLREVAMKNYFGKDNYKKYNFKI